MHRGYESKQFCFFTFCMYFIHTAFAWGESVAVNIITCLSMGVLRNTSWMALRDSTRSRS